jgi:hypothetical protein
MTNCRSFAARICGYEVFAENPARVGSIAPFDLHGSKSLKPKMERRLEGQHFKRSTQRCNVAKAARERQNCMAPNDLIASSVFISVEHRSLLGALRALAALR